MLDFFLNRSFFIYEILVVLSISGTNSDGYRRLSVVQRNSSQHTNFRVELLRSTWKLCFMSTEIDFGLKVDIDNHALCRQILTTTLRSSTLRILNVDLKVVVKICRHKARSSISTLKPTSINACRLYKIRPCHAPANFLKFWLLYFSFKTIKTNKLKTKFLNFNRS